MARPSIPLLDRFWSRVAQSTQPDGCWMWTGARTKPGDSPGRRGSGYGLFSTPRGTARLVIAHRFAYEAEIGPIPTGRLVLHRCDNPPCVRPSHLFLGTQQDNMSDKEEKQRQALGERHGRAKITERDVLKIRALRAAGASGADLARQYGVTAAQISHIVLRQAWRHV